MNNELKKQKEKEEKAKTKAGNSNPKLSGPNRPST